MKRIKTLTVILLCMIILTASIPLSALAANKSVKITVPNLTAVPGDEIAVPIDISENMGIMAMTFTLGYDAQILTYTGFNIGIFNDYTVVDHPDKGYVSFVNCENQDRTYEGNIIVMKFTVKEDAPAGYTKLTIMNIRPEEYGESMEGCFASWDKDVITPKIVNGSVTVGETCKNSGHKYGEWKLVSEPLCEAEGVSNRSCTRCGHTELKKTKALGHDFDDKWTIDKPATADENGKMSRHCKRCEKKADEIAFALDAPQKNDFPNTQGEQIKQEQWPVLETIKPTEDKDDTESSETTESTDTDAPSIDTESDTTDADTEQKDGQKFDTKLTILLAVLLAVLVVLIVFIVIVIERKK